MFRVQQSSMLIAAMGGSLALAACASSTPSPSAPPEATPEVTSEASPEPAAPEAQAAAPAAVLNLKSWKLTLPELDPERGKAREIKENVLNGDTNAKAYQHESWFFVDDKAGAVVFKTPNHLATTKNSKNTRSELREMVRAGNTEINTKDAGNNWVISSHPEASTFGGVGGRLEARLAVDWVSTSGDEAKYAAHAVVVGQIHGSGKTEPLKIFYRKLPGHKKGSLFWNYEIRPADESQRLDIVNDVFGSHQLKSADAEPMDGIALGEEFSYVVDVSGTMMKLTFVKKDGTKKEVEHDLGKGHPEHSIDRGYSDDWLYFKAGAYNQCNLGTEGVWGSSCENRGEEAGDYTQVRFFDLKVSH